MRHWDLQELLAAACGMSEDEYSDYLNNDGDFDELAHKHFEVDFDTFSKVAEKLVVLTIPQRTAVTGTLTHVFAAKDGEHWRALLKTEADG